MTKPPMIPRTDPIWQSKSWQQELADLIRDPQELLQLLGLEAHQLPELGNAKGVFPLKVPRPYAARINRADPTDPLLAQILCTAAENDCHPGFSDDPLAEQSANPVPGLIHKYRGRVLLIVTSNCAIHCRYCFRRHFPYRQNNPRFSHWQKAIDYIHSDNTIEEIILSGGDPMMASDRQLEKLVAKLVLIPHLKRLRIHTRLPVVIPQRITQQCLNWLTDHRLQTIMVIHCNHPQEIDQSVHCMLNKLAQTNLTLLNQTVLLKGVNNNVHTLAALSEDLFQCGVLPYYLHQLDPVNGAARFHVPNTESIALYQDLLAALPGYLVPRFVKEEASATSKTPISIM